MKTVFFNSAFFAFSLLPFAFCLFTFALKGQTVVASSGGFASNGSTSVSWTLGELAVRTGGGANGILTQGFQQPEPSGIISTDEADAFFESLSLFPNPTEAVVTLSFFSKKAFSASWEIVAADGRTVLKSEKSDVAAGDFLEKIDLSRLAAGPYFFILKNEKPVPNSLRGGQSRTARLLKI